GVSDAPGSTAAVSSRSLYLRPATRSPMRYSAAEHDSFARQFNRDGLVVLPGHFDVELLRAWAREFEPLLKAGIERDIANPNRGPQRFYVTLPFRGVFADRSIYEDPDVLAIVERV